MTQTNVLVVAAPRHVDDVRGSALAQTLRDDLQLPIETVHIASLYTIYMAPSLPLTLKRPGKRCLPTPSCRHHSGMHVPRLIATGLSKSVFCPVRRTMLGVPLPRRWRTFTSGLSMVRCIVHSSTCSKGRVTRQEVERVVRDVLANPLIHQWRITASDRLARR